MHAPWTPPLPSPCTASTPRPRPSTPLACTASTPRPRPSRYPSPSPLPQCPFAAARCPQARRVRPRLHEARRERDAAARGRGWDPAVGVPGAPRYHRRPPAAAAAGHPELPSLLLRLVAQLALLPLLRGDRPRLDTPLAAASHPLPRAARRLRIGRAEGRPARHVWQRQDARRVEPAGSALASCLAPRRPPRGATRTRPGRGRALLSSACR